MEPASGSVTPLHSRSHRVADRIDDQPVSFAILAGVDSLKSSGQSSSKEIVKKTAAGQSDSDSSLAVWLRLQKSLAKKNGIALTTLSRDGAAIGRIENDNSICRAMRVSAEHAARCAKDCGTAYTNAVAAGKQFDFTCHAGLHCFAIPVAIDQKQLVILGGRSFASTAEYAE